MKLLLTATSGLLLAASAHALILPLNTGISGTNTERGIVFNLTNTSTQTFQLTGEFNLPIVLTTDLSFSLWIRTGTVVGANVGPGATGWTAYGSDSSTGLGYVSGASPLTPYLFADANGVSVAPGETIGIFIKNTTNAGSPGLRYANGSGSSNTIVSTVGFTSGGIQYTGDRGLGSMGLTPTETNNFFGPTRNFIGEIGYTVIPEPATTALLAGLGAAALVALRRRR